MVWPQLIEVKLNNVHQKQKNGAKLNNFQSFDKTVLYLKLSSLSDLSVDVEDDLVAFLEVAGDERRRR